MTFRTNFLVQKWTNLLLLNVIYLKTEGVYLFVYKKKKQGRTLHLFHCLYDATSEQGWTRTRGCRASGPCFGCLGRGAWHVVPERAFWFNHHGTARSNRNKTPTSFVQTAPECAPSGGERERLNEHITHQLLAFQNLRTYKNSMQLHQGAG